MTISVRPLRLDQVDPEWCRGSLFEVPASLQRPRVALDALPAEPAPAPPPPPPPVVVVPEAPTFGPYRETTTTKGAPRSRPAAGQGSLF